MIVVILTAVTFIACPCLGNGLPLIDSGKPSTSPSETSTTLGGSTCWLDGKQYTEGQVWHPSLPPLVQNCVNCTCLKGGVVQCRSKKCPPVRCNTPVTPEGACCPICDGNPIINNIPPPPKNTTTPKSCKHNGQTYEHEERFTSQATGIRPTQENQCIQCICMDGEYYCHLKTCMTLTCRKKVTRPGDCCPQCLDEEKDEIIPWRKWGNNSKLGGDKTGSPTCRSGGQVYENGATWHPVIGDFGRMDCIRCGCKKGEISCKRLKCPSRDQLPCEKPKRVPGKCCETCDVSTTTTATPTTASLLPRHRKKLPVKEKVLATESKIRACPWGKMDTVVLKSRDGDDYTIVFENVKTNAVQMVQWNLREGKPSVFLVEQFSSDAFKNIFAAQNHRYDIIGVTKQKYVLRFKRRAERYVRKCGERCIGKRITRLIRRLRLKNVEYRTTC